jgi:hypothetical protein
MNPLTSTKRWQLAVQEKEDFDPTERKNYQLWL